MKRILLLFLILSYATAFCQDSICNEFIVRKFDKVTGKTKFCANYKFQIYDERKGTNEGSFSIDLQKLELHNSIAFTTKITTKESICITEDCICYILFRDGTRTNFNHMGSISCTPEFSIYFADLFKNTGVLSLLSQKPIQTIRITTSKGYFENDFDKDQAQMFCNTIQCLINATTN